MNSNSLKDQSDFGKTAWALDQDFGRFERLADELERLEIETENGLERAGKVLIHFSEEGEKIGTNIQALAKSLDESRARAEKAAERVAVRAQQIRERREEADRLNERFRLLGEMVKKISGAMGELQKVKKSDALSAEEMKAITESLPEFDTNLGVLVSEARKLEEAAKQANLKSLSKNADAMAQSLNSAKHRLGAFIERPTLQ